MTIALTGATVLGAFPPKPGKPAPKVAKGPLEVVRFAPEGDVPLAPHLSVTFSQPMVAVTSLEELASETPVRLEPTPKGKWRWVGTKTLLFEPDERFPMATEYTVTVPAGTKAKSGATLAKAVEWTFRTPARATRADRSSAYPWKNSGTIQRSYVSGMEPANTVSVVAMALGSDASAPAAPCGRKRANAASARP